MNKLITYDTLRRFAYVNDRICSRPIRGIVISFVGLSNQEMWEEDTEVGIRLADQGIIYILPYNNPWSWMNPQAVAYTDEIVDVLFEKYNLPDNFPVAVNGASMGGLASLVYTRYSKRTPVCCASNCPVCDLPYHYTERPDLPRTLYSAFFHEAGELNEVLKKASPVDLVGTMPKIPYHIFHCDMDSMVNKQKHSDLFVDRMKKAGHDVTYYVVPKRDHCDLGPEMEEVYLQLMISAVNG